VLSDIPLTEGSYSWRIRLDNCQDEDAGIYVGVASKNIEFRMAGSQVDKTKLWSMRLGCGKIFGGNSSTLYGERIGFGESLEVNLEFNGEKAVLNFGKGGKSFGIAFQDIPAPVYPAVCFKYDGQVTLLE
jgi:hypothetical protein